MIDENAFGILLGHFDLESIEYSLEAEAFLEYLGRFTDVVETRLAEQALADDVRRVDLGHAVYLEIADGTQLTDPITWVRATRQALVAADLPNLCVLTAGGRWVREPAVSGPRDERAAADAASDLTDGTPSAGVRESGAWRVSPTLEPDNSKPHASPGPLVDDRVFERAAPHYGPSEPLRKALAAEAFAQPTTSSNDDQSWGPGLYVEKDAIEQLGKSLKNAPTALAVLSAVFYRIGA